MSSIGTHRFSASAISIKSPNFPMYTCGDESSRGNTSEPQRERHGKIRGDTEREMGCMFLSNTTVTIFPCSKIVTNHNGHNFPSTLKNHLPLPSHLLLSASSSPFRVKCRERIGNEEPNLSTSSAFNVLGVSPDCSAAELKAAFRARVKEFHPDVRKDGEDSDTMIRRVIQAYQMLSNYCQSEIIESCRECLDPFDEPECEAFDIFVNEFLCAGKGCPYSCVERAPHAFSFVSSTGTAHATSQGHGDDYQVQLAVGQCPRSCIHYVTPLQRVILEELLDSIMNVPYDSSAEADLLYSLIVKAKFENNRYQKPKKQPKASTKHVDWF